ncbi:MAG: TIGR03790 family protein [Armatimonadetes bacterium]|nr:TIGR03790 family protein [Armatimonadota bacterium]
MRLLPLCLLLLGAPGWSALTAGQVALLVNTKEPAARQVADHYRQARGVPAGNVFEIELPAGENLDRGVYQTELLPKLRDWLAAPERQGRIRCLLLVYGMPLRVGRPALTPEQTAAAQQLQQALNTAQEEVKQAEAKQKELQAANPRTAEQEAELKAVSDRLPEQRNTQGAAREKWAHAAAQETEAALDSELALVAWPAYDLYRWVPNLASFLCPPDTAKKSPPVVLTARLDGPTPAIAMRLVDDAVKAEREGLKGKVYIDARGIAFGREAPRPDWYGYSGYDESFRELAAILKEKTSLEVVLDDKPELFQPGACPDAALYCGWYSLANYQDAFTFVPGAVAWHLASSEAVTLHDPATKQWCKNLLDHGAAATLGPVAEPYTIGFPKPFAFFVTLLSGKYTLAETYFHTLFLNSWMTTLVGDPLYNPYRDHPLLAEADLRDSPQGAPPPFGPDGD